MVEEGKREEDGEREEEMEAEEKIRKKTHAQTECFE